MRAAAGRTILLLLGLVLGLLATEVGLQVAAAVRAAFSRPAASVAAGGMHRILCVGDSNTYGLYLEPEQSYPSQLERRLGEDTRVINLGHPGANSAELQVQLPRMLAVTKADIVLAQVGVNDFWTVPITVDPTAEGPAVSSWLWEHSRLFRLLYMLWRSGTLLARQSSSPVNSLQRGVEASAGYGPESFAFRLQARAQPKWWRAFPDHVRAMRAAADARGARLVLLTYAYDQLSYRAANSVIRQTASDLAVPLIDVAEQTQLRCRGIPCDELFFEDHHPTEAGYAQEASIVADWLAEHAAVPPAS